ncbi:MAG: antibiotic biosynthesis monooxygenase family protein [Spirosomataceae bacterium]
MLIRIVRMTFQADKVPAFLEIFNASKQKIRAFPGCQHLELLQDLQYPHILMTYSYWDDEAALERYRLSELFQTTWAATKVLFESKPVAFSSNRIETVVSKE